MSTTDPSRDPGAGEAVRWAAPDRIRSAITARLPARAREVLRSWQRSILAVLPSAARLPAVQVALRAWVPCWALRILAVALALGCAALVITGPFGWTVVAALGAAILIRPGAPGVFVLAVVLGFSMLQAGDPDPSGVSGPLLLLGLHACITLCVLLGATSWAAKVQLGVLGRPALRFVVVQLIAQLAGALGAVLGGRDLNWPWVAVAASLGTAVLAYVWLPQLGRRE